MASTELRAAAQQALEALEAMTKHFGFARLGSSSLADTMKRGDAHAAMNNLRAALVEQQKPVVDAAIHAAWTAGFVEGEKAAWAEPVECSHGECFGGECIYTHQSQRPAEPVQEPVAQAIQDAVVYGVGISHGGKRIDPDSIYKKAEPVQDHFPDATKMVQEPVQETEMRRCPTCWEPMFPPQRTPLTVERLRDALVAARIVSPAAVEDPDGYDDGVTLLRIEALHRRLA